ncbi:MAG: hypothetical protein LH617_05105 [Ramlibacter sp.]|nr:hypothetical protein [Ramlibacter sp.]
MSDPSFILQGNAASDLRAMARDLQALLDSRTAGIERPVLLTDSAGELLEPDAGVVQSH